MIRNLVTSARRRPGLSRPSLHASSWPSLAAGIAAGGHPVSHGPTVIGPLLRFVRPRGQTAAILKWEGIVIDPIGAMLAVLVFEAIPKGQLDAAGSRWSWARSKPAWSAARSGWRAPFCLSLCCSGSGRRTSCRIRSP